jgi:hypothetical protein
MNRDTVIKALTAFAIGTGQCSCISAMQSAVKHTAMDVLTTLMLGAFIGRYAYFPLPCALPVAWTLVGCCSARSFRVFSANEWFQPPHHCSSPSHLSKPMVIFTYSISAKNNSFCLRSDQRPSYLVRQSTSNSRRSV